VTSCRLHPIDPSSGEIVIDGSVRRPAGIGVVGGIALYPIGETVAVLAIRSVQLAAASRVRVRGHRALILWSEGDWCRGSDPDQHAAEGVVAQAVTYSPDPTFGFVAAAR
jgi:hypothetical protein